MTRHLGYVLKRFPRISETFVASEIIEMERQGERVTVFALSRPEEPFRHRFLEELEAEVVYLPRRPSREPLRVARAVAHALRAAPRGWLRAAGACLWPPRLTGVRRLLQASVLREEMERAGVDHAHAHFATAAARLADLARRMGGPSFSVTAHAKDIYHGAVQVERLRDRLARASFVATVSEGNRRHLEATIGGNGRLHVVPNSVDPRRFDRLERHPEPGLVLTVARLIEKKGVADLVAACGLAGRRGVELRLEVAGDGPLRSELERAAAAEGIEARFHGVVPQERVLELLSRAAVFCLPCVVASDGDRDGLPTSVLEAMAFGVPVISTALNGLGEVVTHERTGLLVGGRDPAELSRAIERVLTERGLGERLAQEARIDVRRGFALERSVLALRELFPVGR